ncbi:MAG: DUF1289 domain-containing protein [Rubrivivax sp.]
MSPVPSPCTSICRMDEAAGVCEGCLRTIDEISVWSLLDDNEKRALLVELSKRRVVWRQRRAAAAGPESAP